ncbi:acetyl xylan esterase II [Collybia nuda]|uniref:Acetyl xylan esterase II n=1 Tax=Collybia nuda TaxID=64659 RepID=A0A9P5XUT5_9AGAR|nr:acetyl xylan esterase II [Collybia nuda]
MRLSALVTVALAAVALTSPLQKRAKAQVVTKCTVPNTAALTFDDGPFVYLYDVSKALVAAGAKGTFFFNGDNYGGCIYNEDQAKRVKYAYDKGHQIASHTWSHAHLNNLTWDQLHHEFWLVEQAFQKIAGVTPAFMRPPYGEYNDLVLEVAGNRGQTVAIWDFDSRDSAGATAAQSNKLYDDLAKAHPSTILALNHDVYQQTAQVVVPHAIATLQKAGYKLVTLAECLGRPAYQSVGAPAVRDDSWKC